MQKALVQKKYAVIDASQRLQSAIVFNTPCDVLTADIIDNSSLLSSRIILELKDCKNNIIFSEKASSKIKDLRGGYQDALKQALLRLPISNPKAVSQNKANVSTETSPTVNSSGDNSDNKSQIYLNQGRNLQRINISDKVFILSDNSGSVPFATFQVTSKNDVFKVKLKNGETVIGYFENGNIVIDMPVGNGDFTKEIFTAK
ncbi:hypothetical protein ASG01_10670 [Chryseobacterium sp. Leaf180]|uniref:hypothetical protein n=1 Tax=Chryseobacterium sp. Leaf180 TaxID=1736289 RepID=UPI0006F4730C|nr:hypothetical protein [Chryseobacterium sp. Leaf180]KQR93619.1 hypothetical protein ASG01_10670 [Chryseobacterium sp. Leaf180]